MKRFFLLAVMVTIFLSTVLFCKCNDDYSNLPEQYVDIYIDLNLPEFYDLNFTGKSVTVTGGIKGIIIHRKSSDEFKVYDRVCPYDPNCSRLVIVPNINRALDTCCKSEYSLSLEGSVQKGPAKLPLKQYHTQFNKNINSLHITN